MGRYSFFLTCFFLFVTSSLLGSTRDLTWHEGRVIFKNDREIQGEIHIDMDLGLLLIKDAGGIRSFPAFKIKYMDYFDKDFGRLRSFITVPNRAIRFHRNSNIFELVLRGELLVLRKEVENYEDFTASIETGINEVKNFGEGHFIYFLYDGKALTKFNLLNKKRLAESVRKYGAEVDSYVKRNKMNLKDTLTRIKVIAYYNAIHQCKKDGGDC